ncbi:MAG: hypothetical protein H7226_02340 [Salinibacterium sp.]|nr:hypothetical protein [Salinibacterium sp.]
MWTFDTDGDFEGFSLRNAQATVAGGAFNLTVNQADPAVISPNLLGLPTTDYPQLEIRLRNQTADTAGSVRQLVSPAYYGRDILVSSQAESNALLVAEYTLAAILLAGKRVR